MTPKEPYLIRAFHQWIVDNNCTPYIVVDAQQPHVTVPEQFITEEGQITLNISPEATGYLNMADDAIEFQARFSGRVHQLYIPWYAVLFIYARETGEGTGFNLMPAEQRRDELAKLAAESGETEPEQDNSASSAKLQAVTSTESEQATEQQDSATATTGDEPDKPTKRRSHLSVVK